MYTINGRTGNSYLYSLQYPPYSLLYIPQKYVDIVLTFVKLEV